MSDTNRTYRIKADVLNEQSISLNLNQDYESFDILSVNISQKDLYKLHSADYGVIVGRVVANGNFGIPNAKISIFIPRDADFNVTSELESLYPYILSTAKNSKNVRYNLLPDEKVSDCHQVVGTFPNKTYLLSNDVLMDVFDKYYRFTCRTNNSGDYVICGVPVGNHTLHMDLDLSDCGILSQRPRDFVYKGYTIEQFENPNKFREGTEYDTLSQVFTQDQVVNVIPFWGNTEEGEQIGITRADISVAFKFEPTCVFIGSLVSDNASNGISRKCVPTNTMGAMDELVTGEGTIEMIRKTPGGAVEEFQIKGTQLINENGVWCYQIPMNLDYMMTDEYGNMVPTDDPEKGIPTRTRVRFRMSMQDNEANTDNYFRCKVLVPNRNSLGDMGFGPDYDFGTNTREESFRDLFWNYVYSVKSYIPRIQKTSSAKSERFTGIKHTNIYGNNNPMPYNNIRIRIPFMFTLLCSLIKTYISLTYFMNRVIAYLFMLLAGMHRLFGTKPTILFGKIQVPNWYDLEMFLNCRASFITIGDGLCPEMEGWYFAPVSQEALDKSSGVDYGDIESATLLNSTFNSLAGNKCTNDQGEDIEEKYNKHKNDWITLQAVSRTNGKPSSTNRTENGIVVSGITDRGPAQGSNSSEASSEDRYDKTSTDYNNRDENDNSTVCLTTNVDYLLSCVEMHLAEEYRVINFDFYNDWVNGTIYVPRFMRYVKPKRTYLWGRIKYKEKIRGCMDDTTIFSSSRKYFQQCAIRYDVKQDGRIQIGSQNVGCVGTDSKNKTKMKCHTKKGSDYVKIFKSRGGIVKDKKTIIGQSVYYMKPYDSTFTGIKTLVNDMWVDQPGSYYYLYATDLILLGSLNDCDSNGVPQLFRYLSSSSYVMPTNLALTTMNEEAYIYTTSGGTLCKQENKDGKATKENFGFEGISVAPLTYQAESAATANSDDPIEIGEGDDAVPVTEAAGIAWNYAGPDQEIILDSKNLSESSLLYNPGGHFLGISCTESQTTLKSCINLQRICEFGSTMSMRKEIVTKVSGSTNGGVEFSYSYIVPNGIISGDEIVATDPRAMFATMNSRILLTSGRTNEVGYPLYSLDYLRPTGFDGILSNKIKSSLFNRLIETSSFTYEGGSANTDYYSASQSYMRVLEFKNNDYVKFRYGTDVVNDIKKRFIGSNGTTLPQYENSFYFFFGLRNGSTALDEFNKQFYSQCEGNILYKEPKLDVKTSFTFESGGTININVINFGRSTTQLKYQVIFGNVEILSAGTGERSVSFDGLGPGVYDIKVTDVTDGDGGEYLEGKAYVGVDLIQFDVTPVEPMTSDRNVFDSGVTQYSGRTGGYLLFDHAVTINGKYYNLSNAHMDDGGDIVYWRVRAGSDFSIRLEGFSDVLPFVNENGDEKFMVFKDTGDTISIYLKYGNDGNSEFLVYTHTFTDNSDMYIDFGDDLVYRNNNESGSFSGLTFNNWTRPV